MTEFGYDPNVPIPSRTQMPILEQIAAAQNTGGRFHFTRAQHVTQMSMTSRRFIQGTTRTGYELTDRGRLALEVGVDNLGNRHTVKQLVMDTPDDSPHWLILSPHEMLRWDGWDLVVSVQRIRGGGQFRFRRGGYHTYRWQQAVWIRQTP